MYNGAAKKACNSSSGAISISDHEEELSFDDCEKQLRNEQSEQMLSIETYKDLLKSFGWDNFYLSRRWRSALSMTINGVSSDPIEFMFMSHNNTMIMRYISHRYEIPVNDNYIEAIKKIITVLDYIEDDRPQDASQ